MTITTTNGFTQPAVDGSTTVTVSVSDVTGAVIGVGCQIAGAGFYLITNVGASTVTLLNSGSYVNVAPSTVLGSGLTVTYGGLTAPIGEPSLSISGISFPGQTLVYSSSGVYQPTGVRQCLVADSFIASSDAGDDGLAINRMFAKAFAIQQSTGVAPKMYLLPRVYLIKTQLQCIGDLTHSTVFTPYLEGDTGGSQVGGTTIRWNLPAPSAGPYTSMMIVQMVYQGTIKGISFDGSSAVLSCVQTLFPITGTRFQECNLMNAIVPPTRQASTVYIVGQQVLADATNASFNWNNNQYDNGHLYIVSEVYNGTSWVTTGSAQSGSGSVNWASATSAGATIQDGNVMWKESGPSPANMLVGNTVPFVNGGGSTDQCDSIVWEDCLFSNSGKGWATAEGNNTRTFRMDRCQFQAQTIAFDWNNGSGSMTLNGCIFLSNQLDIRKSGVCQLAMNGCASENSNQWVYGSIGGSIQGNTIVLNACYWAGQTRIGSVTGSNGPTGTPTIRFGGELSLNGCLVQDMNTNNSYPYILLQGGGAASQSATFFSVNNKYYCQPSYAGPYFLPVLDTGANGIMPGQPFYYSPYQLQATRVTSFHDVMVMANGPETTFSLPNYTGGWLASGLAQLGQPSRAASAAFAVENGSVVRHFSKFTVVASAIKVASTTTTVVLAQPWNRARIMAVYTDTTGFSGTGITGVTLAVGGNDSGGTATGATLTTGCFMAATSITSPGQAQGAGTALGAMIWGPLSSTSGSTNQWQLTATFTSTGANLNALSSGSIDIYVEHDVLSAMSLNAA